MTTSKVSQPPFDLEGKSLHSIAIDFSAEAKAGKWKTLVEVVSKSSPTKSTKANWLAAFIALPTSKSKNAPFYLKVDGHPHSSKKGMAHWIFQWIVAPKGSPPSSVRQASRLVGGYPKVLAALAKDWPSSHSQVASVIVAFNVSEDRWKLPIEVEKASGEVSLSGGVRSQLTAVSVQWILDPPCGILSSLLVARGKSESSRKLLVIGTGSMSVTVGIDMLKEVEEKAWEAVKALLTPA